MDEKQRTRRIRHELEKTRVQLARQDAELEALEAELDPEALEEAERSFADGDDPQVRLVKKVFADRLPRVPTPTPSLKLSRFAIRV